MKKTIGITNIISGILLIAGPRFILPACEYAGFSAMRCSDTAQAAQIAGLLLLAIGSAVLFLKSTKMLLAGALAALALSIISFALPVVFGYCRSASMPCNYGMVPGIKFVAVVNGLVMITGIIVTARGLKKKGTA